LTGSGSQACRRAQAAEQGHHHTCFLVCWQGLCVAVIMYIQCCCRSCVLKRDVACLAVHVCRGGTPC
jgi:hypothetical protein